MATRGTPLKFKCPSCGRQFAPVPAADHATQVVRRTCRGCGERWQIVVRPLAQVPGARLDEGEFTFLGH